MPNPHANGVGVVFIREFQIFVYRSDFRRS